MSIKTAVEQLAGPIGEEIGASDHLTQASLLNGFCRMLAHMTPLDNAATDMQIAYFTGSLERQAKIMLRRIADFCLEDEHAR